MRTKAKMMFAGLAALLALGTAIADWKIAGDKIRTRWAADVRPDKVLPEYPRPQMARDAWQNLNGLWDYAVRPKAAARPERWDGEILVPFCLESALSGVGRVLQPAERLWYHRTVTVKPPADGGRLLLHFGAVDWRAEVWVNGTKLGQHEGGYEPFSFDITDALARAGKQEIIVGVWDPTDTLSQPRGKQVLDPKGIWYTPVSGIWQTVWLEPVPARHIRSLKLTPDLDGKALRLVVNGPEDVSFVAKTRLKGRVVGSVDGHANLEEKLPLATLAPWSPDEPTLYDLEVKLASGDVVRSYFALRKVEVKRAPDGFNRIFLNNQPLFQFGPLDQGWWPDGLYTAPTDEALRYDIETTRQVGMNMCRKHIKVEPARWYYWCDKLGLMVWQDMPSGMDKRTQHVKRNDKSDAQLSPDQKAVFRRELSALLNTLHNHPCIVTWVPFNEGWGQHDSNEILKWVKQQDPGRLVDGPSGWADRGWGDLHDRHCYPGPDMFPVQPDRASVLGEFGGLGLPLQGHLWQADKNWGYKGLKSKNELEDNYRELILKLRPLVKRGLAAAVYTQTTDVEIEVNGLMTYDRAVTKLDPAYLRELHAPLYHGQQEASR